MLAQSAGRGTGNERRAGVSKVMGQWEEREGNPVRPGAPLRSVSGKRERLLRRGWLALIAFVSAGGLLAAPATEEDWFERDWSEQVEAVSDGELRFLAQPPREKVHHQHNRLTIHDSSLEDGWVDVLQCHEGLDAVPRAQVVFGRKRTRGVQLVSYRDIRKVWVEGASVQLEEVGPKAELCVKAQMRTLTLEPDGSYTLLNGPFMRRFLDGYYPLRVSADVSLESRRLAYADIDPPPQPGFHVWQNGSTVHFDAWFDGRLVTRLRFFPQGGDGS
jgi:hypothetical protein